MGLCLDVRLWLELLLFVNGGVQYVREEVTGEVQDRGEWVNLCSHRFPKSDQSPATDGSAFIVVFCQGRPSPPAVVTKVLCA